MFVTRDLGSFILASFASTKMFIFVLVVHPVNGEVVKVPVLSLWGGGVEGAKATTARAKR